MIRRSHNEVPIAGSAYLGGAFSNSDDKNEDH